MPTRIIQTKFYTFRQNNSGGTFIVDDKVCHTVIIEAESINVASARAEDIGIYFDGVRRGRDCPCCGNRWDEPYEEGTDEPLIYGRSPEEYYTKYSQREAEVSCRVYYNDGTIKEY